jgi:hypothetical protein
VHQCLLQVCRRVLCDRTPDWVRHFDLLQLSTGTRLNKLLLHLSYFLGAFWLQVNSDLALLDCLGMACVGLRHRDPFEHTAARVRASLFSLGPVARRQQLQVLLGGLVLHQDVLQSLEESPDFEVDYFGV